MCQMHGLLKLNEGEIMKKALSFLSVLIIMILFSGCTKIPEKTDIEELIGEISDEIANQCGNGITNEGEECDFEYIRSCSSYDPETVGPIKCENCFLDFSNCQLKESCNTSKCNSKGECKAIKYLDYEIYCDCFDNRTGEHCEYCSNYFHFDFDRECISDSICTEIGCELENQECFIDGNSSKCRCKHPWTGEKCDECIDEYFKKDNSCVTDNCSLIKCFDYEKCDNSSGVALCVCISDTQDPNDCSKCLYGYDWDSSSPERCINKKTVNCIPPNFRKLPENAEVITSTHELYYTPESGWTNAPECEWQCKEGYVLYKNSCTNPLLKKVYDAGVPFGIDKNGYLITGNEYGEIYFFSNNQEPNLLANTGLKFVRGLIGGDGNIYFGTSWTGRGVFDTDSHKFIYLNVGTNKDNMSILQNGAVVFGSDYLDFPVFKEIDQNNPNQRAATVSDEQGNILTVFHNGTVIFNDKDWNLIWEKQFDNYFFGDYPVLDKKGHAYLPYCTSNESNAGVITIELSDGSIAKSQIDFTEGNCNESFTPAISIGNNDKKYVVYRGVLRIYDENNILLTDTKNINIDDYSWGINVPPVITDKNEIFFGYNKYVFCVNELGELNWKKIVDYSINTIIHYDNRLFVPKSFDSDLNFQKTV